MLIVIFSFLIVMLLSYFIRRRFLKNSGFFVSIFIAVIMGLIAVSIQFLLSAYFISLSSLNYDSSTFVRNLILTFLVSIVISYKGLRVKMVEKTQQDYQTSDAKTFSFQPNDGEREIREENEMIGTNSVDESTLDKIDNGCRESMLYNQPLNSDEYGKLFFSLVLLTFSVFFAFGIPAAVFIFLGFIMMKIKQDFSYIDTAVKYCRLYLFWES